MSLSTQTYYFFSQPFQFLQSGQAPHVLHWCIWRCNVMLGTSKSKTAASKRAGFTHLEPILALPPLHSHYWCSCRMNYQLTAPKLHKYDSNKRCLADYFRWFFQTQLYFPLFWKENPSHSLSPHLLLFSSTLTISSVSLGQTGRQCS